MSKNLIILDDDYFKSWGYDLETIIYILSLKYPLLDTKLLELDKVIIFDEFGTPKLSKYAEDLLDLILKSNLKNKIKETKVSSPRSQELVDILRAIYPEGKKPGTPYYWRGNSSEIKTKLDSFFERYKKLNISNEMIIKATENYVKSYEGDRNYMQLLKYFIEKNGESALLTFIENYNPDEVNTIGDWTSTLI